MRTDSIPKFTSGHWNPNLHKYGVLLTPWNNAVRSTESTILKMQKKCKKFVKTIFTKNLHKKCNLSWLYALNFFLDYRFSSIFPPLFFRILNSLCTQVTHTLKNVKCQLCGTAWMMTAALSDGLQETLGY